MKMLRCQNPSCGKFFTAKRMTAKYCHFPAPQHPKSTCSEYYPQFAHREKLREDNLRQLEKQAFGRLYNDRRRNKDDKSIQNEVDSLLRKLQIESPAKREAVMAREITEADYKRWLDTIRRGKGEKKQENR